MPNPTARSGHVDGLLTNISIQYRNKSYIADLICPIVPVKKQSDIVPKYDQSAWFRDDAKMRAAGTKSRGGGFKLDVTDTYYCHRFSRRMEIDDDMRDNIDAPFDLDTDATNFVTDKAQLRREVAMATDFFTTGVWGADKTGGADFTVWSDYANSTPLLDISTYQDSVEALIGIEPNKLVIGKQVWLPLKWHPDLIETIKYTQRGQLTLDLFTALTEFEQVLVGRTIKTATTSPEGTAEASVTYSRVWGKNALMLYVPPAPSLLTPAAMYTFVWNKVANAIQYIKRMRDEEREVDIIEVNSYFDQKVTAKNAGVFLSGAVA